MSQSGKITPQMAQKIILKLSNGLPSEYGVLHVTGGQRILEYLKHIEEKYLRDFIRCGGSSFKIIEAPYGEGKTHSLFCIRELAWKQNYVVSYIPLSPNKTPFHDILSVYRELIRNLMLPQEPLRLLEGKVEKGINSIVNKWISEILNENVVESTSDFRQMLNTKLSIYESSSFRNAIIELACALLDEDYQAESVISQWLMAESSLNKPAFKRYRITYKITLYNVFKIIRSLIAWLKDIGYSGLIVLFDEVEMSPSINKKNKSRVLNTLREIIDSSASGELKYSMWFYAVPDLYSTLLGESGSVYEALNQRIKNVLPTTYVNYYHPVISLKEDADGTSIKKTYYEIGSRIITLLSIAFDKNIDEDEIQEIVDSIIEREDIIHVTGKKRRFIQEFMAELQYRYDF